MNHILRLISVSKDNLHILENLTQAYEAEFSRLTHKMPDENGKFSLDSFPEFPYEGKLFYAGKTPIGFCVYNLNHTPYDIAEFYIIPTVRRKKYGEYFAHQIFLAHKGKWQVRQINGADNAVRFWGNIISKLTHKNYHQEIINDPEWGLVTKQVFMV